MLKLVFVLVVIVFIVSMLALRQRGFVLNEKQTLLTPCLFRTAIVLLVARDPPRTWWPSCRKLKVQFSDPGWCRTNGPNSCILIAGRAPSVVRLVLRLVTLPLLSSNWT